MKACDRTSNGGRISRKELQRLRQAEKRATTILLWAAKMGNSDPIVAFVVADMLQIAPNAVDIVESRILGKGRLIKNKF